MNTADKGALPRRSKQAGGVSDSGASAAPRSQTAGRDTGRFAGRSRASGPLAQGNAYGGEIRSSTKKNGGSAREKGEGKQRGAFLEKEHPKKLTVLLESLGEGMRAWLSQARASVLSHACCVCACEGTIRAIMIRIDRV